jgi:hypothetical protein
MLQTSDAFRPPQGHRQACSGCEVQRISCLETVKINCVAFFSRGLQARGLRIRVGTGRAPLAPAEPTVSPASTVTAPSR